MSSVSLLELLDEAIGTPEVNVNLEALRKLLKVMLGHLSLLGLQGVFPLEPGAQGAPDTSGAAGMGQMEKTEAQLSPKGVAGTKAVQCNIVEDIQRIKEELGQTSGLCKDLSEEVSEMKATQSRMGEDIRMIQEALGQDAAPAKPKSTTPGIQTGTSSAQSDTTGTQPGSQEGHPAIENITSDLSELQGQMSSLESLARDLQGEKKKIRQLEVALGKLGVTAAECEVDDTNQILQQQESALQEIKQEQKELREEQNITKVTLKQLVTADQLQEQLNELGAKMESMVQEQESVALRKLRRHCEKLQKQVDSMAPQQVQSLLPQKTQDEELLKSIQATVVRVEGDCEQLSYVTGSLRDDHLQNQKDIKVLFQSLEGLEKKADKEDLMQLKADKAALGSKVSCAHFDASMEHLEDRLRELLRRMSGQEQRWQEAQQRFRDALDYKLDRLELGPFQKQLEDTWARIIKDLRDELSVKPEDAAGIKQQLLVPFKCLSCDRQLNVPVPGPHIDTLPLLPSLPSSHAAHLSNTITEEQAQQHGNRKLVNGKSVKSQSCTGQDASSKSPKDLLLLSKKPDMTELLGTDDRMDQGQEHKPEAQPPN